MKLCIWHVRAHLDSLNKLLSTVHGPPFSHHRCNERRMRWAGLLQSLLDSARMEVKEAALGE